jgi:phage shock protein C
MRSLREFRIDRGNGKILGVCAGIANHMGWDPTFVRVGMALLMLAGPFPWTLAAYALVGVFAKRLRPGEEESYRQRRATPEDLAEASILARRQAEIDSCVASADSSLAREIEQLRRTETVGG